MDDHVGDDTELVVRCREGDNAAFQCLHGRYSPLIRRAGRRNGLRDADLDDLEQHVWLAFWRSVGALQHPERLAPWLWVTATNECRRRYRGQRRLVVTDHVPEAAAPPEVAPDARISRADDHRLATTLLSTIRPDEQHLIALLVADRRPDYRRISTAVHRPVGSLGPTRARILKKLRDAAERCGALA